MSVQLKLARIAVSLLSVTQVLNATHGLTREMVAAERKSNFYGRQVEVANAFNDFPYLYHDLRERSALYVTRSVSTFNSLGPSHKTKHLNHSRRLK